jgi:alkanesulfonate monooxygenase SsuD/methylene tetrahydromethanopterin reductase-like flavin-dependent oxidoreductase (luciferase family)
VTDPKLGLHDVSLGSVGIPVPPLTVGGRSPALLELAARHADGCNAVVEHASQFAKLAERLDSICTTVGRACPLARTVQVFLPAIGLTRARQLVRDLGEAGADTAMFVIPQDEDSSTTLQQLASVLQ